jgi:hypothetical protein
MGSGTGGGVGSRAVVTTSLEDVDMEEDMDSVANI